MKQRISLFLWYGAIGYIFFSLGIIAYRQSQGVSYNSPDFSREDPQSYSYQWVGKNHKNQYSVNENNLLITNAVVQLNNVPLRVMDNTRKDDFSLSNAIGTGWILGDKVLKINNANLISDLHDLSTKNLEEGVETDKAILKGDSNDILQEKSSSSLLYLQESEGITMKKEISTEGDFIVINDTIEIPENSYELISHFCEIFNTNTTSGKTIESSTKMTELSRVIHNGYEGIIIFDPVGRELDEPRGLWDSISYELTKITWAIFGKTQKFKEGDKIISKTVSPNSIVGFLSKGFARVLVTQEETNIYTNKIIKNHQETVHLVTVNTVKPEENNIFQKTTKIFMGPLMEDRLEVLPRGEILIDYGFFGKITKYFTKVVAFIIKYLGLLAAAALVYITLELVLFLPQLNFSLSNMNFLGMLTQPESLLLQFGGRLIARILIRMIVGFFITKAFLLYLPIITEKLLWSPSALYQDPIKFFSIGGILNINPAIEYLANIGDIVSHGLSSLYETKFVIGLLNTPFLGNIISSKLVLFLCSLIKYGISFFCYILTLPVKWFLSISLTGFAYAMLFSFVIPRVVFSTMLGLYGKDVDFLKNALSKMNNNTVEEPMVGFQWANLIFIIVQGIYCNSIFSHVSSIIWLLVLYASHLIRVL